MNPNGDDDATKINTTTPPSSWNDNVMSSNVSCDDSSDNKSDTDKDLFENDSMTPAQIISTKQFNSVMKWKVAGAASLIVIAVLIVTATSFFLQAQAKEEFETAFHRLAGVVSGASHIRAQQIMEAYKNAAESIQSQAHDSSWPYVTIPHVEMTFSYLRHMSFTDVISFSPLVEDQNQWETFSVKNQNWIQESQQHSQLDTIIESKTYDQQEPDSLIPPHIHRNREYILEDKTSIDPFAPIWQISPPPPKNDLSIINHNLLSDPLYVNLLHDVKVSRQPVLSGIGAVTQIFTQFSQQPTPKEQNEDLPHSVLVQPVYDTRSGENNPNSPPLLVALIQGLLSWDAYFTDMLPLGVDGIIAVVTNNCNQSFTYEINGNQANYLGMGDLHETRFTNYGIQVNLETEIDPHDYLLVTRDDYYDNKGNKEWISRSGQCNYQIYLYPSSQFQKNFDTVQSDMFITSIVFVLFITGILFFIINYRAHQRLRRLILTAEKSNNIVSELFPENVRDRIMKDVEEQVQKDMENADHSSRIMGGGQTTSFFKETAKLKLKSFLNAEHDELLHNQEQSYHNTEFFNTKPIADLFPEATVLFADIVGFTAWSSVREPSQVFQLLETIYWSFDNLAKRRRVFKVETVGDCYVAATGLPDPRKDHAVVMARFARDCMSSIHDLTKKLEVSLGPDTGELSMRFGIHSGPVTAGVLRGEKSRFQLFGDTMNTASRIETTGIKDQIHLSQETADLLVGSGKGKWVTPRKNKVMLKGKGEVHTYWLSMFGESQSSISIGDSQSDDDDDDDSSSSQCSHASQNEEKLKIGITEAPQWTNQVLSTKRKSYNSVVIDAKMERLVAWNVAQLVKLLQPIVARRNCLQNKTANNNNETIHLTEQKYNDEYFLNKHGKTVLEEVKEIIELPKFDALTSKSIKDPDMIELEPNVVKQLHDYVTNICKMYKADNPFHNFEHASHVTMSVSKLLSRIIAPEDIHYDGPEVLTDGDDEEGVSRKFAAALHDHTYGITSDPLTQFAVAFSALIHDVDHSGVPNTQLVTENTTLGSLYKNKSVAEQHSVDMAWDLLMTDTYTDLRNVIYSNETEFLRFRQLTVNSVMATDIVDKGLKALRDSRWAKAFSIDDRGISKTQQDLDDDRNRKATIVIEHLIQASDVAHTMQHWHVYRKWNERFFREMYLAYKAGRSDKDPSVMWYKGEIGFFDFYIIPLARKLKECGVFGVSSDEYLNFALNNRAEWVSKGESVVEEMLEKVKKDLLDKSNE